MRIVVATAAVLLLAGCSESISGQAEQSSNRPTTASTPTKTSATSPVPTTSPAAGAPIAGVIAWVGAGAPAEPDGFHTAARDGVTTQLGDDIAFVTPSGTKCMTNAKAGAALACLAELIAPPPRPADSYGEWIGGWVDFDGTSVQVGSAHGDPGPFAKGVGAPLPAGTSVRFGDYQCRADTSALICVNYAHQSGVRVADTGVEPFGCLTPAADAEAGIRFSC